MVLFRMRIINKMLYQGIIWFEHVTIGKNGLHTKFVFKSDEPVKIIIEMLRARAKRHKRNYHNQNKVHELIYIHLSEYEPAELTIEGGYKLAQTKCLYVGK